MTIRAARTVAIAALLSATSTVALAQSAQNTVTIAYPADVASWDAIAHTQAPGMPMFKAVFDQPLDQTPDGKQVPHVIREWKWLEEGKVLEVTLRDDVTFHNGDKLTTADLRFSYVERTKADNRLALAGAFARFIEDIEIKSPTVAVIKFNQVVTTPLQWMAFLANFIMPKNYFESVGGKEKFLEKPIGSGPFRLVEYERGSRIVLERFDNYWGPKAKTQRVVVQIVRDASARVAAIQARQVDVAYNVPLREAVRLGGMQGMKATIEPITNIIMLQLKNDGVLLDERVRLAMHHAINKQAISRALYEGKARPISFTGVPGMPGEPKGFNFPYDPKKAEELLKAAGFSKDKPAKFTLLAMRGVFPSDWELANILVQEWKKVGIDATIEQIEQPQYYELNHNGKLKEATLFNWSNATLDPEIFTGYILNPNLRFSAWKSDDMKTTFDALFKEGNYAKRIAEYERVNRLVVEKGYTIPLMQEVGTMVTQANVNVPWYQSSWIRLSEITKN